MDPAWILSVPEDVTAASDVDGGLTLVCPRSRLVLRRLVPGLRESLLRLSGPGDRADRLAEHVHNTQGADALARWHYYLQRLAGLRMLSLSVQAEGRQLASLEPIAPGFVLRPAGSLAGNLYVLSRFAWLHRRDQVLALESPVSDARIVLHDPRAAALVAAMARPGTVTEIGARVPGLPADAVSPFLGLLVHGGMACPVGPDGSALEDSNPALRYWEFHDLLFHSRSRIGRHDGAVGASYSWAGRTEPPPALASHPATEWIDLYRPDLQQLQRCDPPFARVQEQRRSIRQYGAEPVSDLRLGEFLYRVARVRESQEAEIPTPAGTLHMDFALRPYPSGGGLYELEVYVAVNACRGLSSGLYYYDPLGHRLGRRSGQTAEVKQLFCDAAVAAGIAADTLQVLLILAARLPRLAWKYSGLAYALILKHVGVVFQTMYLAATAMELAPCAIGAGDSDRFARTAKTDSFAETAVGEFLLGSRPVNEQKLGQTPG